MPTYVLALRDVTVDERRHCAEKAYDRMIDAVATPLEAAIFRTYIPRRQVVDYAASVFWISALDEQQKKKTDGTIRPSGDGLHFVGSIMQRVFWLSYGPVGDGYMDGTRAAFLNQVFRTCFMEELYELFLPSKSACRLDAALAAFDEVLQRRGRLAELSSMSREGYERHVARFACHEEWRLVRGLRSYLGWAIRRDTKDAPLTSRNLNRFLDEFAHVLHAQLGIAKTTRAGLIPATR